MRTPGPAIVAPTWAELEVDDVQASVRFYRDLLDWTVTGPHGVERDCRVAFAGRHPVCAIVGGLSADEAQWTVFLGVPDVQLALDAAEVAGAVVLAPPMQVMEFGRLAVPGDQRASDPWRFPGSDREIATMAVFADPEGVVTGLWAWRATRGAVSAAATGGILLDAAHISRDPDAAQRFYSVLADASGRTARLTGVRFARATTRDGRQAWLPRFVTTGSYERDVVGTGGEHTGLVPASVLSDDGDPPPAV